MEKPFVLLADDNEAVCTLITALLKNDFTVEIAGGSAEAIEKLKKRRYAAILVDLQMQNAAGGYAILDALAAEQSALLRRTLALTGALEAAEMERLRSYGIRFILTKPFEVDTLQTAVKQCAGLASDPFLRGTLLSGGVLLLIADLLRRSPFQ